jgi:hypothetical protein
MRTRYNDRFVLYHVTLMWSLYKWNISSDPQHDFLLQSHEVWTTRKNNFLVLYVEENSDVVSVGHCICALNLYLGLDISYLLKHGDEE